MYFSIFFFLKTLSEIKKKKKKEINNLNAYIQYIYI